MTQQQEGLSAEEFKAALHALLDENPGITPVEIKAWIDGMVEAMEVREHFLSLDN